MSFTTPTFLATKTASSKSLEHSKKRVISLYRQWYRAAPEIVETYSLVIPVSAVRSRIRQEFEKHRYVQELPVIDVLIFKSLAEYQETMNFWKFAPLAKHACHAIFQRSGGATVSIAFELCRQIFGGEAMRMGWVDNLAPIAEEYIQYLPPSANRGCFEHISTKMQIGSITVRAPQMGSPSIWSISHQDVIATHGRLKQCYENEALGRLPIYRS